MNIFDGLNGILPALDIVARPHPDDKEYQIGRGENYFPDGLVINDDCMLHELYQNQPAEMAITNEGCPRALTKAEVRALLLDTARSYAHFWASQLNRTPHDRCDSLCFSLMTLFDGTGVSLPAFDIVTRPQADAKDFAIAQGQDYCASAMAIKDDCSLHDLYYRSHIE